MALDPNLKMALLHRSLEEKLLLGLYSQDGEPNKFTVGWLIALSDESYVVATVDERGRADEFQAGFVDNLYLVVLGGEYLESISNAMMDHVGQWSDPRYGSTLGEILLEARNRDEIMTLYHRNDFSYNGRIVSLDDSYLAFDVYSSTGRSEGQHVFRRDDIGRVALGGPEQRNLAKIIDARTHAQG
jgi:hypothetical protein